VESKKKELRKDEKPLKENKEELWIGMYTDFIASF